jgi:hypothetical protein
MTYDYEYDYEEEREESMRQSALTQGEWMREAFRQYAYIYGAEDPTSAWILTPYDTWERNPFYVGPAVRHPEDDHEYEGEVRQPTPRSIERYDLDDDYIPF